MAACLLLSITCARAADTHPPFASPATNTHIPGKFVWFELLSSDPPAAQHFYASVFGWRFEPLTGKAEGYTVVRNEERPIAGLVRPSAAREPASARWLVFVSTADLKRTLKRLQDDDAQVLVPATNIGERGPHAIVRDEQGALLGVLQSASGDRPDDPVAPGDFIWVDLYARNPASAAASSSVLGLEANRVDGAREERVLSSMGFARAGILPLPDASREPGWLAYVQVEDVPATMARVRAAGGTVLREPGADVEAGQYAVFADPQGAILGVIRYAGGQP
jgi:predicted enzyme related to lactoylglutathione lyase